MEVFNEISVLAAYVFHCILNGIVIKWKTCKNYGKQLKSERIKDAHLKKNSFVKLSSLQQKSFPDTT